MSYLSSQSARGKAWMLAAAFTGSVALLDAALRLEFVATNQPVPWQRVVALIMAAWLIYVILVPPALFIARRFRLDVADWPRSALIHLLAVVILTCAHILIISFGSNAIDPALHVRGVGSMIHSTFFRSMVRTYFSLDFLTYWTSVGAFYAFHYYQKARQQELAAVQLQASLTEARLQMLRCQLNPHFLFNTLNAMSVLVLKGEQETVMEMLVRLSDLLRMTLDETRPQKVPLEEELTLVDRYLAIQAVRFENRLTIERHVAPETTAALVPSMILQPVLENAIEHGVAAECGPSRIAIQTSRENGRLRLEVSDSGPGFHSALPARSGQGIGLVNTRARLEQLYGANQRIEYGRSASGGAAVTIVIPFE